MILQKYGTPFTFTDVFNMPARRVNPAYCFVAKSEDSDEASATSLPKAIESGDLEALRFRDWWLAQATDHEKELVGYDPEIRNFCGTERMVAADARPATLNEDNRFFLSCETNGFKYTTRSVKVPGYGYWTVASLSTLKRPDIPEEVDRNIAAYLPDTLFLNGSDQELVTLIEQTVVVNINSLNWIRAATRPRQGN